MFRSMLAAALLALPITAKAENRSPLAAGSLKAALTDLAGACKANSGGLKVKMQFAASGLLRERSEQGAKVDVFASADGGHPSKLAAAGYAKGKIAIFARNELCALAPKVSRSQRMACSRPCSTHRCGLLPRRPRRTPGATMRLRCLPRQTRSRRVRPRCSKPRRCSSPAHRPLNMRRRARTRMVGSISSGQADVFLI